MIWHKEIKNIFEAETYLTLNEGNTPEVKFFHNKTEIIIKREDLNPTGSWKDRGSAIKVTEFFKNGTKKAVIASSGNAAISLLEYVKLIPEFVLHIVVSPSVNPEKLNRIQTLIKDTSHKLYISENSRKKSVELAAQYNCVNLRSSIDELIVKGYWSLGFELKKYILPDRNIAVIAPVSSGTAFVGLAQGMQLKLENDWQLPKFYAVQTTQTHTVADSFEEVQNEEQSLADAIVDRTALRAPQILKILNETNGQALAITNQELDEAKTFVISKANIELSYTSLLSVAAYLRLVKQNVKLDRVILIASGT